MSEKTKCVVCEKDANTVTGWHLKRDLDFCSNVCVSNYIEGGCKPTHGFRRVCFVDRCLKEANIILVGKDRKMTSGALAYCKKHYMKNRKLREALLADDVKPYLIKERRLLQ